MRYLNLLALLLLSLVIAACNHDEPRTFDDGRLVNTPSGGANFGVLETFDTVTYQATIADLDDEDGYDFRLANDALVIISVESLGLVNPFVELYDAEGFLIIADEDGGVETDALIVSQLGAGDYTIIVLSSLDGPEAGDYEINVIVGPLGVDLELLDIGVTLTLNDIAIAADDDAQSYVFTLVSPANVDMAVVQSQGAADLAIQLVDQRGFEVFFVDPEELADPVVTDEPLDRGTYLLIVSNALGADSGVYDLTLDVKP